MFVSTELWDAAALNASSFTSIPSTDWSDTFTGTDGTALAAHTPGVGSGGYTDVVAGHAIVSNTLHNASVGVSALSRFDPAASDFTLTCTAGPMNGPSSFLSFRVADTNNKYRLDLGHTIQTLNVVVAGVATPLASSFVNMFGSGTLTIVAHGAVLTVLWNGAQIMSVVDLHYQTQTPMEVALNNGGTSAVLDTLVITTP